MTKDDQILQAANEMMAYGMPPGVISRFINTGSIVVSDTSISENYLPADKTTTDRVRQFEEQYGAIVYAVIRANTLVGVTDTYLYTTQYQTEWQIRMANIKRGTPRIYMENLTYPECSEFGYVRTRTSKNGLVYRVG